MNKQLTEIYFYGRVYILGFLPIKQGLIMLPESVNPEVLSLIKNLKQGNLLTIYRKDVRRGLFSVIPVATFSLQREEVHLPHDKQVTSCLIFKLVGTSSIPCVSDKTKTIFESTWNTIKEALVATLCKKASD